MGRFKKSVWPFVTETWAEFQKDEAGQRGAALAFYSMFSIFPLLLLLLAMLGWVIRYWDAALDLRKEIVHVVAQYISPQLSQSFADILSALQDNAGIGTGTGLFTLLLGASAVFQQLDSSFHVIWKVPEKPKPEGWIHSIVKTIKEKFFSFGMVLALGFLLLISLVLTSVTQALTGVLANLPVIGGTLGYLVGLFVTLALDILIFALLFKYLPDTKVRWGDVLIGATLSAIVWEIAKRLLTLYIARNNYVNAYGTVGAVLVLMAWVYFSSQMIFLGAEFTEVYSRRCGSRSARSVPPSESEGWKSQ